MANRKIGGITFDLWDTVFIDDSDEAKRKEKGIPSKPVERRELVHSFLNRHEPISRELVDTAYDTIDAAYHKVWHDQLVTWSVHGRLTTLLKGLDRELPENELSELIRIHEEMELNISPDLVPGVADAIRELRERKYKLAVISDTIFSPGTVLRKILDNYNLLCMFDVFVFSDEVGCSKPDPRTFEAAARGLGVSPSELIHIGDRDDKDIAGAHAAGARGILCTAVRDRRTSPTKAESVFDDYSNLSEIIEKLEV